jgi:hypothetical protein
MGVDERPRSEPEVVHAGDQLVTLEDRLGAMERSIRRLTIVLVALIGLLVLHAIVGPEAFGQLVQQAIELVR